MLIIPNTVDLPTVTNEEGGQQSATLGRFDLVPGEALVLLAQVYGYGASPVPGVREAYPVNNWQKIPGHSHINHALEHLAMLQIGRTDEDHLAHALCRLSMAAWCSVNRPDTMRETSDA